MDIQGQSLRNYIHDHLTWSIPLTEKLLEERETKTAEPINDFMNYENVYEEIEVVEEEVTDEPIEDTNNDLSKPLIIKCTNNNSDLDVHKNLSYRNLEILINKLRENSRNPDLGNDLNIYDKMMMNILVILNKKDKDITKNQKDKILNVLFSKDFGRQRMDKNSIKKLVQQIKNELMCNDDDNIETEEIADGMSDKPDNNYTNDFNYQIGSETETDTAPTEDGDHKSDTEFNYEIEDANFFRNIYYGNTIKSTTGIGEDSLNQVLKRMKNNVMDMDRILSDHALAIMLSKEMKSCDTNRSDNVFHVDNLKNKCNIKKHRKNNCNKESVNYISMNSKNRSTICSEKLKSDLCLSVLNDSYTQVKRYTHLINLAYFENSETFLYKIEDKLEESDQHYYSVLSTLESFNRILESFKYSDKDEKDIFGSPENWTLSNSLYRATLKKIYGHYSAKILKNLQESPKKWTIIVRDHLNEVLNTIKTICTNNDQNRKKIYNKLHEQSFTSSSNNNNKKKTYKVKIKKISIIKQDDWQDDNLFNSKQSWSGNCKGKNVMVDVNNLIVSHVSENKNISVTHKFEIRDLLRSFVPNLFAVPKKNTESDKKIKLETKTHSSIILTDNLTEDLKEVANYFDYDCKDINKCRAEYLDSNGHIKRPKNAFMIYAKWRRKVLESSGVPQQRVLEDLGKEWHSLENERKHFFKVMADKEALFHLKLFPNYKYAPKKKGKLSKRSMSNFEENSHGNSLVAFYNTFIADNLWFVFFRLYEKICKGIYQFFDFSKKYQNLINCIKGYLSGYIDKHMFERDNSEYYNIVNVKLIVGQIIDMSIHLEKMVSNTFCMICKDKYISHYFNKRPINGQDVETYVTSIKQMAENRDLYLINTDIYFNVEIKLFTKLNKPFSTEKRLRTRKLSKIQSSRRKPTKSNTFGKRKKQKTKTFIKPLRRKRAQNSDSVSEAEFVSNVIKFENNKDDYYRSGNKLSKLSSTSVDNNDSIINFHEFKFEDNSYQSSNRLETNTSDFVSDENYYTNHNNIVKQDNNDFEENDELLSIDNDQYAECHQQVISSNANVITLRNMEDENSLAVKNIESEQIKRDEMNEVLQNSYRNVGKEKVIFHENIIKDKVETDEKMKMDETSYNSIRRSCRKRKVLECKDFITFN